mgnify:CR=1 FL=1
MNNTIMGPLKSGMHIVVRKADGRVIDFGEAIDGNWRSQFLQRFRIWKYRTLTRLGRS